MRMLVCLAILAAGPLQSFANPVPMQVANRLNELPDLVVGQTSDELRSELTTMLGRYGFGLLDADAKATLKRRFDLFSPILVASQRPGFRVDSGLQEFFWSHADSKQQGDMVEALFSWLHADLAEAPQHGGMRLAGPPSAVSEAILRERIDAAHALSLHEHQYSQAMITALMDSCAAMTWNNNHPCSELVRLAREDKRFCPSPSLHFVSEQVTIHLTMAQMRVEADYDFSRIQDAKSALLWYPFPEGDPPKVESVSVAAHDSWVDVGFSQSDGGLSILLPVEQKAVRLRVRYRQFTLGRKAEYIVKSTALWGKPLESAHFIVLAPSSFDLTASLPLEKIADTDGMARYELIAEDFLPDRDFVLTW